jgi:hypothetical protein
MDHLVLLPLVALLLCPRVDLMLICMRAHMYVNTPPPAVPLPSRLKFIYSSVFSQLKMSTAWLL